MAHRIGVLLLVALLCTVTAKPNFDKKLAAHFKRDMLFDHNHNPNVAKRGITIKGSDQVNITKDDGFQIQWDGGILGPMWDLQITDDGVMYIINRGLGGTGFTENPLGHDIAVDKYLIQQDAILKCHVETGYCFDSFGAGLFNVPHGIALHPNGSLVYVADGGRHQVFVFNTTTNELVKVLGQYFSPGSNSTHLCRPTDVAYDDVNELLIIADGACNHSRNRLVFFDQHYNMVGEILECGGKPIVLFHDLSIDRVRNVLAAAQGENHTTCLYDLNTWEEVKFIQRGVDITGLDYRNYPTILYLALKDGRVIDPGKGYVEIITKNGSTVFTDDILDNGLHSVVVYKNKYMFVSVIHISGLSYIGGTNIGIHRYFLDWLYF